MTRLARYLAGTLDRQVLADLVTIALTIALTIFAGGLFLGVFS